MLFGSLVPAASSDNSPRGTKVTAITSPIFSLIFTIITSLIFSSFPSPAVGVLPHTPAAPQEEERRVLPPGGREEAKSARTHTFTFVLSVTRRIKLLLTEGRTPGLCLHTPAAGTRPGQGRGGPDASPARTRQRSAPHTAPPRAAPPLLRRV